MKLALSVLACVVLLALGAPPAVAFTDVLDTPARLSPLASRGLLQGVTRAGNQIVAVGQRGHIVISKDEGATWTQAKVPVSADLTAVYFIDASTGWATGHDGVILATTDAGATWSLQLDGRKANKLIVDDITRKATAEPGSERLKLLLAEATRAAEQGADRPFLDIWFADARNGYAVGAYNFIFRTSDGGKTWEPWFDRSDNDKFLNLYAIRPAGGALYIAGEAGLLLVLDPAAQRFRQVELPYKGTLFGVMGDDSTVVVFGLRGNVFRTQDGGRNWTKVEAGLPATVVAGVAMPSRQLVLADMSGRLAVSDDAGRTFKPAPVAKPMPLTGIASVGGANLALVGLRGVAVVELSAR